MGAMLIVGLLAGVVSRYAAEQRAFDGLQAFEVNLVIGLGYALIVGGWLVVKGPGRSPGILGWALLVVAAWVAAARVGMARVDPVAVLFRGRGELVLAGLLAGAAGGAGIALANTLVLRGARTPQAFLTVAAVGAAAGATLGFSEDLWLLVIVWQGAVAGATAATAR